MDWTDKRVVVKIGTKVLTNDDESMDNARINSIIDDLALLHNQGVEVVVVTSGAVGVGKQGFELKGEVDRVTRRQVLSAIGQSRLMSMYQARFEQHNITCAQVLVTQSDFGASPDEVHTIDSENHFKNVKNCMEGLIKQKVIPVLNENDVIALDELMFTDNDELAGLITIMLNADLLVILTCVPGLLANWREKPTEVIEEVAVSSSKNSILEHVTSEKSSGGRGGMESKIETAFNVRDAGISTFIVNGKETGILGKVLRGDQVGTKFHAEDAVPENVLTFLAAVD